MQRIRRLALLVAIPMLLATAPVLAAIKASPAGAVSPARSRSHSSPGPHPG